MKFVVSTLASSLLLLSIMSAVQAKTPDTFSDLLRKSAAAATNGDWRMGVIYSQRLVALPSLTSAESAAAWAHLCTHLTNTQKFEAARVACDESIAFAPTSWAGYLNRSNLLFEIRDYSGAYKDFEKAKTLNPSAPLFKTMTAYSSTPLYVIENLPTASPQVARTSVQ
jgi:tetratricopeptide (TPR) repeat protein